MGAGSGWSRRLGRDQRFILRYQGDNEGRETIDEGRQMIDEGRLTKMTKRISSVRDLEVYRLAFDTAMEIFEVSKIFPKEEKYSLTDQVRRSSRSVCTNLAEGCLRPRGEARCLYMC
jgi:hypothetical protein